MGILEETIIIFRKNWFRSSPRLKNFSDPHLDKIRSALTAFAEPSAFKVHTLTFQKTIRRQGMEFENILKFRQKSSHENWNSNFYGIGKFRNSRLAEIKCG